MGTDRPRELRQQLMRRLHLRRLTYLLVVGAILQTTTVLAENRRDIKIPCGGTTVTEQIALKVSEAGATWTVRVFADNGCQFKKSTATIVEGLTAVNWNSPHVAEHVTEVTYQVRVTDQSKEGKMTITGELEPRPGAGGGGGHSGSGSGGSGQPKTFSVTVLLRVVQLEFTSPANGAPLSVCVGGSANLTVLVRVGDGKPPSTGTVTWQVSTGLPGTAPSPTPLQEGIAETTFTSNGSLTSGTGTITAQVTNLTDANGKPMPDVSATVPGYVTKVIGITPANPTCELGGEVELTAVLDPPDAPAPPCLTWSVYPTDAGTFSSSGGAIALLGNGARPKSGAAGASGATKKFHLSLCAKPTPAPQVKAKTGAAEANAEIVAKAETAEWQEWIDFNVTCPSGGCVPIYDERSKEKPDECGNVLQAKCRCRITRNGSLGTLYFYFIPQGGEPIEVGKCCFSVGAHRIWYKEISTADGSKRFVAAYHFNADLKRGADGAPVVPNRYVWRVRKLDFLTGDSWSFCGEKAPPFNSNLFGNPNNNQDGTEGGALPCTDCP